MKQIIFSVVTASLIAFSSSLARAQDSNCTNYWINPDTGAQECLGSGGRLPTSSPSSAVPAGAGAALLAEAREILQKDDQSLALSYLGRREKRYVQDARNYCNRRRKGESHRDIKRIDDDSYPYRYSSSTPEVWRAERRLRNLNRRLAVKHFCPEMKIWDPLKLLLDFGKVPAHF